MTSEKCWQNLLSWLEFWFWLHFLTHSQHLTFEILVTIWVCIVISPVPIVCVSFESLENLSRFKFLVLKFIAVLSFQRDFAVGICNKISEMIQGMYASFSILK